MSRLSPDECLRVLRISRALDAIPTIEIERAGRELAQAATELTGGDDAVLLLVQRLADCDDDDPLDGWRVRRFVSLDDDPEVHALWEHALRTVSYLHDPHSQALVRGAGAHRAVLSLDAVTPEEWADAPNRALLRASGTWDHLYGVHHIDEQTELFVAVRRQSTPAPFGEHERDLLLELVHAIGRVARRIALAHGLLARAMLTDRERETLTLLLRGLSEKEIADEMGLADPTVHSYVTTLYRKFAVRSRPELMSLWLDA